MPSLTYIATAVAFGVGMIWLAGLAYTRRYWELIVWIPGICLMLIGVYAVSLYEGDVDIFDIVSDRLEIQKTKHMKNNEFHIRDGDTIIFQKDISFRLQDIDAPEDDQCCKDASGAIIRCGVRPTNELRSIIGTESISCTWIDTDRDGRLLATCYAGQRNLNAAMVSSGYAIAYHKRRGKKSAWKPKKKYLRQHMEAESAGRGLHGYKYFERPHEFRANMREGKTQLLTSCRKAPSQ